ncbi:MAG TPA: serine hydrolase domain-containing protein [Allosphingosinicella sp.]|jgi:CubicO group peptidase (beta-lactamase class C family)
MRTEQQGSPRLLRETGENRPSNRAAQQDRAEPGIGSVIRRGSIGLLIALGVASNSFAQAPAGAPSADDRAARVDQLFAEWNKPDTPGCALATVQDGQGTYRAYGRANLELGAPTSPATVFQAGSIAKQFTAMSVLLLAQSGRLSLDDPVRRHLPEMPDFGAPLTLRHLIHHTSGLRDQYELLEMAGWRPDDVITRRDVLAMVARQRKLNHLPGSEYAYTNTGYTLLGLVVERVSGRSLADFAQAEIFAPLGMASTRFVDDHRAIIPQLADGYLADAGGYVKWTARQDYAGPDNLFTTVEDLARWQGNFNHRKVGGAAIDELQRPGVLAGDPTFDYAFGLIVSRYKGLRVIHHGGSRLGYRSHLMRFPDHNWSVALLCNSRINAEGLARGVADIYLADRFEPPPAAVAAPGVVPPTSVPVPQRELSAVAGLYWNPVTDLMREVRLRDGKLWYRRGAGSESELVPLGRNRFFMAAGRSILELSFERTAPGAPHRMLVAEPGRPPLTQQGVRAAAYAPEQLAQFGGTYRSAELGATYVLVPQDGKLLMKTGNWGDFLLTPRFADSFENLEEMGTIVFTRDARRRITGFVLRSGKVRNLRFERAGAGSD